MARPSRRRSSSVLIPIPVPSGPCRPIRTCWIGRRGRYSCGFARGEQITTDRLSDKQVARTTKHYIGGEYSAHSHRASFVTIAKLNGADDSQIMQQTKHRTRTMIDRYTRVQQVVRHNAAMKLGL